MPTERNDCRSAADRYSHSHYEFLLIYINDWLGEKDKDTHHL